MAMAATLSCLTVAAADTAFFRLAAPSETSLTGLDGDGTLAWTNSGGGSETATVRRATNLLSDSWVDYIRHKGTDGTESLRVFDPHPPEGMAYIPAGLFTMGDSFNEGGTRELPTHTVYVSAFHMDRCEVTKGLWDEVADWAWTNGYDIASSGASGVNSEHPAQEVTWFECAKWCNARSEKQGLAPCYTIDGSAYRTNAGVLVCNWEANGYRLPTEAEWEKAARGGLSGRRFPWGNNDWIDHDRANYDSVWTGSTPDYTYDKAAESRYHPDAIPWTYTVAVGSCMDNGYGLHDMAGNVWEWCWDWNGDTYYGVSPDANPHGPESGSLRTVRGGGWSSSAFYSRVATRLSDFPTDSFDALGFRSVRAAP